MFIGKIKINYNVFLMKINPKYLLFIHLLTELIIEILDEAVVGQA